MKEEEVQEWKAEIDAMTHEDMARLWRFSAAGSTPYFNTTLPIWPYFKEKWDAFGGWNPTLSKKIGG